MDIVYLNPKNRRYVEGSRKRKAAPFAGKRKSKHGSGSPALNRAAWDNLVHCVRNDNGARFGVGHSQKAGTAASASCVAALVLPTGLLLCGIVGYALISAPNLINRALFGLVLLIPVIWLLIPLYILWGSRLTIRYGLESNMLLGLIKEGTSTTGTVVAVDRYMVDGTSCAAITYRFTPPGGEPLSGIFRTATAPEINVGDQVAVLYISDAVHILL